MQPQNQPRNLARELLGPDFGKPKKNTPTYSTSTGDDEAQRIWNSSTAIRQEFLEFSTFSAWHKANNAGLIRVLGDARK